ncbi:hypothetical protein ACOMHN_046604 [Nucella lapillus]
MKSGLYSGRVKFVLVFATLIYAVGVGLCRGSVSYTLNYPTARDAAPTHVGLFLAATGNAQVQVNGVVKVLTPYTPRNETTSVLTSAISINVVSFDDFAAVVTKGQNSVLNMDGFRPLPHKGLGNDYTISAWEPTAEGHSFVVVSAAVSAITVKVNIPNSFPLEVTWNGTKYTNGDTFAIILKRGEAIQLTFSDHDPTGIRVWTADGTAFSVLAGTMATALNGSLPGNVYDVTPPYNLTSQFYVGVPVPGRDEHVWRLVSTANATIAMFVVGRGGDGDESAVLDKGEHYDFRTNSTSAVFIFTPNPGVATLYTPSDESSPPTMASLYPMNLWHCYYVITPLDPTGVMLEHVTITIVSTSSSGVRMTSSDGVTKTVTGWTRFDASFFSFDYVSVELTGVTSLWHVSDASFQAIQSATNVGWAYAFSAGCDVGLGKPTTLSTTTSAETTSASTLGISTSSSTPTVSSEESTISTSATTPVTMTSSSSPSSTSPSSTSSFLPSWLDEAREWIIAGSAVGGVALLVATLTGVVLILRKHNRRRRPSSVSPSTSTSPSTILVAPRSRPRMALDCGKKPVRHKNLALAANGDVEGHKQGHSGGPVKGARPFFSRQQLLGEHDHHHRTMMAGSRMAPIDNA